MADFSSRRICVVGSTGSGKSTLAEQLARQLHIPHVELDALHWEPGWKEADRELTRARVREVARNDAWVVDGNYGFLRDILWVRAEVLIWLDYPLALVLWRLWWRTWRRIVKKEVLWGTNRERLWGQFFSKDSLFLWALKTYGRHKRTYTALPMLPEYAHLKVYRFKSPRETEAWVYTLSE